MNYGTLGPGQNAAVTIVDQVDPSLPDGTVLDNLFSASSDEVNLDLTAATASVSFTVANTGPILVDLTPSAGAGNEQVFRFQFTHPSGYQSLDVLDILTNRFLDGRQACYLAYSVTSSTLLLVNDQGQAGGPFAGAAPLGSSVPIQNSQCSVTLVSAVGTGNTLSLALDVTFKQAFGGNRIVYVAAQDHALRNTGWQGLGVWQIPFTIPGTITVTGLSPQREVAETSSSTVQMQVTLMDTKGGDFGVVNILINDFLDGRKACYLAYVASSSKLILVDDQGNVGGHYAGSLVLNGAGSIANGQCTINGTGSAVSFAANTLKLTLNLTFDHSFAGNRVVYVAGRDIAEDNNTDWQAVGTLAVH